MALSIGRPSTLQASGWKGVRDIEDPYAVSPQFFTRLRNMYLPEPKTGCGAYARPGFRLANAGAPLGLLASGRYGQAIGMATIEDGTRINFCVLGGKLYRISAGLAVFTDVTPAGIVIDANARVHLTPFSNRLVVNDGVHTPWVASNLQATPVTGTKIDYTGDGAAWVAYGPATVFDGAIVFIVRSRNDGGVAAARTSRIGWSEPDDPFTGYFQPNFDNEWDVVQNGTDPIYALAGTNAALDYFRDGAIGYLSGTLGADFRTTATKDAIDEAIGTRSPATLRAFGNRLYFADTEGRPQVIVDGQMQALWRQLRRVVTPAATRWPDVTKRTACAELVPELDLYLAALWSPDPTQADLQSPTTMYAFDAQTGIYVGEWVIGPGVEIHAIGIVAGPDNQHVLAVLGSEGAAAVPQAPGSGGFLWILSSLEDGVWADNDVAPDIQATTPPLGFQADILLSVDRIVATVQEIQTDAVARAVELEPTALVVADGDSAILTAVLRNVAGGVVEGAVQVWIVDDLTLASVTPLTDNTAQVTALAPVGTVHIQAQITAPDGSVVTSNTCVLTLGDPAAQIQAVGGTIVDAGGFRTHTFLASDTFQVITGSAVADVLCVGGGGAGGGVAGSGIGCGGGGGGGVVEQSGVALAIGTYAVTVGDGGVGALSSPGASGQPSSYDVFVAAQGGGGGGGVTRNGVAGASGGGGASAVSSHGTGGAGTPGQGNAGGDGAAGSPGGGGGGAGAAGVAGGGALGSGAGGAGAVSSISGAAVTYGGGGGGGHGSNGFSGGVGGAGGGHDGGTGPIGAATPNLGGGGGGSGGSVNGIGGNGGSGIVIIRYRFP